MKAKLIKITPTLAVAGLYGTGDQVGGINTVGNAVDHTGGQLILRSITIIDKAKESKALDVFFFDSLPTVASIDNGTFDVVDSEMAAKCIGKVSIAATDYSTASGSSVATKEALSTVLQAASGSKDLYAILVTRNAPTYANGDLKILLGLEAS